MHRAAVARAAAYDGDHDAALILRLLAHPSLMLLTVSERRQHEREALQSVARLERLPGMKQ